MLSFEQRGKLSLPQLTGIVYEPLTEDAHGNYMTEQEITKAAYWFAKNGNQVDVQHSFEPLEKAAVVESYVAPCDMSVGEQAIKKGTWMMTVEVDDPDIFEKVQKGEITGFSMGGVGKYSDEDDPLPDDGVAKAEEQPEKGMRGIFIIMREDLDPAPELNEVPIERLEGVPMCLLRSDDLSWAAMVPIRSWSATAPC